MDSPAVPPPRLLHPSGLPDMLLYRMNRLRAVGGGMVLRYCEGKFGVTRREWVLLALLALAGEITSSELAARAGLEKSATSKAVMGLVAKELVRRRNRRGDRRYSLLSLTPAGRALYERILPIVDGINRQLMAPLTPSEIALLDDFLARMEQRASEMLAEPAELPRANRRAGRTRARQPTTSSD